MKKILTILAVVALAIPAFAQFRPSGTYNFDLLSSSGKITLPTTGVTNIVVPAYIGKDGFSVTPVLVGTNAGTANLAILAIPAPSGVTNTAAPTALGNVAMNGTTPVRSSVFVAGTTFYGTGTVVLQLTNAHTASLVISNLYIGSW
jgi:hypothetical protein